MLSKTRGTPAHSPAPGVILDTITTDPVSNGTPAATEPKFAPEEAKFASEHESAASADGAETRAERFRRKALRGRLHGYAVLTIALVAYLIALAASNTAHVKVDWVFGSSQISRVAGAVHSDPRLAAREPCQREVPLAHPRAAPPS